MTRLLRRLHRLLIPVLALAFGAAAMTMFMRTAFADPTVPPLASTSGGLSWDAWVLLGLGALAGVHTVIKGVILILKPIAPRTETTLDDRAEAFFERLDGYVGRIEDVARTVVPRQPRDPQSGKVRISVLVAIALIGAACAGATMISCTKAQLGSAATTAGHAATTAGHEVVNCTAQELGTRPGLDLQTLAAIVNLAAAERAKCTALDGHLEWPCVEADLLAEGKVLGGCAFVRLVADAMAAVKPSASALAATPPPPPGRAELEDFRARVAGGATFHTATGDW